MSSVNYSDDVVSTAVQRYQQRQRQYSLQQYQQPVAWIMPRSYDEEHVAANRGLDYNTLHGDEEGKKGFGLWKSLLVILVLGLIVTNGFLLVGTLKGGVEIVEDSTVYDCRSEMQAIDCDGRNLFLSDVRGGANFIALKNCPSTGVLIVTERDGTRNVRMTWGGTFYTCAAGATTTFLVLSDSALVKVAAF